jgi:hypothetical protein
MSKANEMFDAYIRYISLESDMDEALIKIFNLNNLNTVNTYACEIAYDITYDYYDCSFELLDVNRKINVTDEHINKCTELGFSHFWINYIENAEGVNEGVDGVKLKAFPKDSKFEEYHICGKSNRL